MRRRSRGPERLISRRKLLLGMGAGIAGVGLIPSKAFDNTAGDRASSVAMATDENALIGIDTQSPVQKNSTDPLTYITNTLSGDITVTLSLNTCSDGTLYAPDGSTGCTVSATIGAGNTNRFDINADVSGQYVDFTIDVSSSSTSLSTSDRTFAEAGNVKGAVVIQNFSGFAADTKKDEWTLEKIQVKDDDGDDDLDRIEYEITDSSGTTVSSKTVNISGGSYNPPGKGDETFQPDDASYNVQSGETYTLTATAYDVDGNSDNDTLTTTA